MHAYVCIHLILKLCITYAPWYNIHVTCNTIDYVTCNMQYIICMLHIVL